MFTGLIQATGTIVSLSPSQNGSGPTRITIASPELAPSLRTGDSIAVSGVCLTALDITPTTFSASLAQETVTRTTLAALAPGRLVNLELPTPAGSPLGGHVVQGHVDAVATLLALDSLDPANPATTDWRLRLAVPPHLTRYIASQGSITVNGISLTVADITGHTVSIAIIPHTYAHTNLHTLPPGTPINVEVDALAKYAERQGSQPALAHSPQWTVTEDYLLANGY